MHVQKRPLIFFESKNIFIFGAGPNFGRGQKRGFTLYNELAKVGQKDEKQWFFEKVVTYI